MQISYNCILIRNMQAHIFIHIISIFLFSLILLILCEQKIYSAIYFLILLKEEEEEEEEARSDRLYLGGGLKSNLAEQHQLLHSCFTAGSFLSC